MNSIVLTILLIISIILLVVITFVLTVALMQKMHEDEIKKLERDNDILRTKITRMKKKVDE